VPEPVIPVFGTPRTVAGDVDTADTMKCQLRPIDRNDDYGPLGLLTFSDQQWSQLQTAFAEGVCDYSKPPVGVQPTVTWLKYGDDQGNPIYGGAPLPPAPIGVARGWASEAFTLPEPGESALLGAGIALLALLARRRAVR
jgi:hypothetical protein